MSISLDNRIKNAKNIIDEMLTDRGYNFLDDDLEIEEDYLLAENEDADKVIVYFFKEDKFNIQKLKYYISNMNDLGIKHCIIVYANQITSSTKKHIEDASDLEFEIELFSLSELQYNITKHYLVSQHSLVNSKDASILKKNYGSNIPIMFKHDPVSRYYNYKKGDIIKVVRKDGFIVYRIVR